MNLRIATFVTYLAFSGVSTAVEVEPIAPMVMESTFKIEGKSSDGKDTFGTCFLLSVLGDTNWGWNVLITANHVLSGIASNEAILHLRLTNEAGVFTNAPAKIQIRLNGVPLWRCHPEADVAALIAELPSEFVKSHHWLPSNLLAGDETFKSRDIRPGDELMCLGYPLGLESGSGGFPILRSARIGSYPVHPTSAAKTFLLDMTVYGGNSGGPVFFDFRKRQQKGLPPEAWVDVVGIAGLISQDISETTRVEGYFETSTRRTPLGLAIVVPGEFIKQTVGLLVPMQQANSATKSLVAPSPTPKP